MFYFIGIVQILILAIFIFRSLKNIGISIFTDGIKLMFMLWLFNISLYNLRFSKLYNPNWQINMIVIAISILFFIVSRKVYIEDKNILASMEEIKSNKEVYNIYSIIINIVFIIAFITFWFNVSKYGLAILATNKIDKQPLDHYAGYIIYMMALCAQIKYILYRTNRKIIDLIIFILSIGTLLLTLNRGPIAFIVAAIFIYELFNLVRIKDMISKKKLYGIYISLVIAFLILLQLFGYVGDMRMEYVLEHVYGRTINEHYQMNEALPSGFLWGYIYLTSPLENAAYAISNQGIDLTYFNNLLYPFIKFGANIFGVGDRYKAWLLGRTGYVPYLNEKVGLNVSSFIPEAMQDFGYLGVMAYILIYIALAYLGITLIKKKKISSLGAIVVYVNIISILAWSVFDNSLKIPVLILNILFVLFIEVLKKIGIFNKIIPMKRQ